MVPILTRFARLSAFVAIAFMGATAGAAEPPKFAGMAGDFSPIDPPEQIAAPNFQDKIVPTDLGLLDNPARQVLIVQEILSQFFRRSHARVVERYANL